MEFPKWPLNLVLYRLIWAVGVIFSLTLIPVMLSAFINSTSVLIACSCCVNFILFCLSVMMAQWAKLINSKNVLITTPSLEHFAAAHHYRKQLEKDYQLVRQDVNKLMG
jgi:hypothetical protein